MLDQLKNGETRARLAQLEAHRVPLSAIARWFGPWIVAGVLMLVFVAGLWSASSAVDNGTYAIGLAAAALAFVALVWELVAAFGDRPARPLDGRWLVEDETSLVILLALLIVLAVGGLVLAARSDSVAAQGAGYGLCLFALLFISASLKHYFDRR